MHLVGDQYYQCASGELSLCLLDFSEQVGITPLRFRIQMGLRQEIAAQCWVCTGGGPARELLGQKGKHFMSIDSSRIRYP